MSILESEYIEESRPYSQHELKYLRDILYKRVNLGPHYCFHDKCKHFYIVKNNSRKEKEIIETNTDKNVGNCSVCWKLNKTPKHLKDKAYNIVNQYCDEFYNNHDFYTYNLHDLESVFYKWLYLENNTRED